MTDEAVQFRLDIIGGDQVAAAYEKVTSALKNTTTEMNAASDAAKKIGDEHEKSTPKLNQFGSTLGMVGGALGQTNPALGMMVSTIGQATGTITAMEAALGPLGIAIGLASAAFALYERATARANDTMQDGIETLSTYIGKLRQADEEARQLTRTQRGLGSALEQRASIAQAQDAIASAQGRMDAAHSGQERVEAQRALDWAQQQLTTAQRAQEVAERRLETEQSNARIAEANAHLTAEQAAEKEKRERDALDRENRRGRRGGGGSSRGATDERAGRLESEMDAWAAEEAAHQAALLSNADKEMDHIQAIGRAERAADARRAAAAEERKQRENAAFRERMDHIHAEAQAVGQYASQVIDIFANAANAQGDFGKNLAAGFKTELEAMGKKELVMGLSDEAEAIGLAFINPPAAGAKATSGAMHLAVSALAFGGSAVAGAAAGGGGAPAAAPASTTRPTGAGGGSGGGGGETINVNILGPMIAADSEPSLGRTLDRALRAGRRRYGRSADGTST